MVEVEVYCSLRRVRGFVVFIPVLLARFAAKPYTTQTVVAKAECLLDLVDLAGRFGFDVEL